MQNIKTEAQLVILENTIEKENHTFYVGVVISFKFREKPAETHT